ncbi:MAG: hypothetical protein FWE61_02120 [Micrococcales bacterium]|nr:hypothetical protein [Micrococcales bacterium]
MELRKHRPLLAALTVAALAVLTAGCTNNPGPATTTEPQTATASQEEPPRDPQLATEREALQRLKDYHSASNQLGQTGYGIDDISAITSFTAGDYATTYFDQVAWLHSQGAVQVGEATQTNYKVVDHHAVSDPFFDDQLTIEVCNNTTDVNVIVSDGSSVLPLERRGRFVSTITMWHSISPDTWLIAEYITDGGRPC